MDILAEAESDEPPGLKCEVSCEMTICVHSVHWFKAEENLMRMKQTKIESALWSGVHALQRLIVAVEACLSWKDTLTMSGSLPKLASYKSKNVIQDWIADPNCAGNLKHRPGHMQPRNLQRSHEYPSRVSDSLGCGSVVCPNDYDIPAQAASSPQIQELISPILTQALNMV